MTIMYITLEIHNAAATRTVLHIFRSLRGASRSHVSLVYVYTVYVVYSIHIYTYTNTHVQKHLCVHKKHTYIYMYTWNLLLLHFGTLTTRTRPFPLGYSINDGKWANSIFKPRQP